MRQVIKSSAGKKMLIFAFFTVVPLLVGKLVIPLDWFAFRCYEGIRDTRDFLCPGARHRTYFYPNQTCVKQNTSGSLAIQSRYAESWPEEWITDSLGNRNSGYSDDKRYEIVVMGDSDIAGAGLDQKDMINVQLGRIMNANAYSWAPDGIVGFLQAERFKRVPPYVFVASDNEKNVHFWPFAITLYARIMQMGPMPDPSANASAVCRVYEGLPFSFQRYLADVRAKPLLTHFLHDKFVRWMWGRETQGLVVSPEREKSAAINSDAGKVWASVYSEKGKMFFDVDSLEIIKEHQRYSDADITKIVSAIKIFHKIAKERGILFIYAPIPSKWSIYWDLVPDQYYAEIHRPDFLLKVLAGLEKEGVPTVDLTSMMRFAYEQKGLILHHTDDNHMNAEGARLVAATIAEKILSLTTKRTAQ